MVRIEFSIGGLSMEKVEIPNSGDGVWNNTLKYIRLKLKAFGRDVTGQDIGKQIRANHGWKFSTGRCGQRLQFDIYKD